MPDAPDADRRPVPYRREPSGTGETGSLTEAPTLDVLFEDNQVADTATAEPAATHRHAAPRRSGGWASWAVIVAMLAAAGLLFWAPWRDTGSASSADGRANAAAAAGASATSGAQAPGPTTRFVNGPIVPTRISIPAIGVNTTVEHRGTVRTKNAFTGQLVDGYGVPTSMRTTSWWSDGPEPGSGQMAVVLGHTQVGGYGVFNKLGRLQPGSPLTLSAANGDTLRLQVLGSPVTGLSKATSALADTLNSHPAQAAVALVTCGGTFDKSVDASQDNVVVFASLIPPGS